MSSLVRPDTAGAAPSSFDWVSEPEPHAARRKALLARYPEIKELFGPCRRTKYVCTALVAAQLVVAWGLSDAPFWLILCAAYVFGGVVNHALLLAIHELAHNLAFDRPVHNRLFALLVNLPIGVPAAATFRHYHLLHHAHQGEPRFDTDLPTELEAKLLRTRPAKALWMLFQGVFYAVRPLVVCPKRPDRWELANLVVQLSFDAAIHQACGWHALSYLLLSSFLGMGLHPVAGHFLSEHYAFSPGQETYSYYGPLNRVAFNVGYHNEHHDFPYIPGSRLPRLRKLAPEFYDTLAWHTSWVRVIWQYITNPRLGGYRRVKRVTRRDAVPNSASG